MSVAGSTRHVSLGLRRLAWPAAEWTTVAGGLGCVCPPPSSRVHVVQLADGPITLKMMCAPDRTVYCGLGWGRP